ncbi:hypothetical protein D770_20335 [Flammeovirgaceae bacterium 311]|nr:hypothetical protein D770_20335 [Flammeovirgaceae bacterium 311]
MKRIAFLILFAVFSACLSSTAQIGKDDLLISRQQYQELKSYHGKHLELLVLQARFDSLISRNRLLTAELGLLKEGARIQHNTIEHLESRNTELQLSNYKLNTSVDALRSTANKYRYRYEHGPQFREYLTYSILWAGLMSAAFYMAMTDDLKQEALIVSGVSGLATITLALTFNYRTKKLSAP